MLQLPKIERIYFPGDNRVKELCDLYCDVFSEPPYREITNPIEVRQDVIDRHLPNRKDAVGLDQCVIVATTDNGQIVGFGCAHGALAPTEPSIRQFLLENEQEFPFPLDRTVFMSELGVAKSHRGFSLGVLLILERFRWARERGYVHYLMRTAEEGSHSAQIYLNIGAKPSISQTVRTAIAGGVSTASECRRYYCGDIGRDIADNLEKQQAIVRRKIEYKARQLQPA